MNPPDETSRGIGDPVSCFANAFRPPARPRRSRGGTVRRKVRPLFFRLIAASALCSFPAALDSQEREQRVLRFFTKDSEKRQDAIEEGEGKSNTKDGANGLLHRLLRPRPFATGKVKRFQEPVKPDEKSDEGLGEADIQALVNFHNRIRREVGVGPVKWNGDIADFAQEWADELARTGTFQHRPASTRRYGENIAMATTGTSSVAGMAEQWYVEKRLFEPGSTFRAADLAAGHYTQMVWRNTSEIGAGLARFQTGRYRGMTILVTNYSPRGNVVGEPVY